ncbi:MAG: type 1 glutamine amidotransferase [Alphaproteobacteria bacterium]|nr:type 1 glutamine amidotransferase [Alphaproteobacteria bacterium]
MKQKFRLGVLVTGPMIGELKQQYGEYDDIFARFFSNNTDENDEDDSDFWHLKPYRVLENIFPQSVNDADGWLITGSRYGVYETHEWIAPLEDFIRTAQQANVPMIGICFGHQIMAQALGGTVEPFADGWIVGSQDYHTQKNGSFNILSWHQDQVIIRPKQADIIAHNDACRYAALLYQDWGLSFQAHPEFTPSFFNDLFKLRGNLLPQTLSAHIDSHQPTPPDSAHIAKVIKGFLHNRKCDL